MIRLPAALALAVLLSSCAVVEVPLDAAGTVLNVTGTVVETTVDVVTDPLRDDD